VILAKVTDADPLKVRLKGDLVDTPVSHVCEAAPGDLAEGDDVLVEVLDRRAVVIDRIGAA